MAQWKHGWIPLTSAAAREKNHGRTPKPGGSVAAMMAKAKRGQSSGVRSTTPRTSQRTPGKPDPSDDVSAAQKAVKDGNPARAVNLLTRAMSNAKGADKAAIKKQRDELARRLMRGR